MSEWVMTSSILILLIIGIRACFGNKIALRARYALWLVVALRLLVPLSFSESSFSVLNFLNRVPELDGWAEVAAVTDETTEAQIALTEKKMPETFSGKKEEGDGADADGHAMADADGDGFRAMDRENTEKLAQETGFTSAAGGKSGNTGNMTDIRNDDMTSDGAATGFPGEQNAAGYTGRLKFGWKTVLLCIWAAGAVALACIVLSVNKSYRRRIYNSRVRYRTKVKSALPVYVTSAVLTPCMFGLIRPAVYLTPGTEEDDKALRYILCHENTHYRHRDNLWVLVRVACVCLHWYNPLVWLAAELSRQDCELACDEMTLKLLDEEERIDYGRTLLDFSVQSDALPGGLRLSTAVAGGKKQLKERLLMIVSRPRRPVGALAMTMALVLLVSAFTFTGRINGQEASKEPSEEGTTEHIPDGAAYRKGDKADSGESGVGARNRISNTSIVPLDLKDGQDYTLKIFWENEGNSEEYQIERMELNRIYGKTEEVLQAIRLDEVKVLYTLTVEDIRKSGGEMWTYSPEKESLYAKALRTAEDLPADAAGAFSANGSVASLAQLCDGGILVEDLNFDGYQDFCLRGRADEGIVPYYCWLWDPEEARFHPGYMIPNISVDAEAKLIESAATDENGIYSVKYYRFDEYNTLHMVRYTEKDPAPDAVLPALDLTYCETGYTLPAVDEWDYGTGYGGALTERFVRLAKEALTELYEWSGTRLESVCFAVTDGGEVIFGNTPKDIDASRIFYYRCYGEQAGFENGIRDMILSTERVAWFSPVTQWNVPENLAQMTDEEVVLWYFARSALAEGETAETIEETYDGDFVIGTAAGNYYEMTLHPVTREITSIYGPYDDFPMH